MTLRKFFGGLCFCTLCLTMAAVAVNAVPIPPVKPFVVRSLPQDERPEPDSVSYKAIIILPKPKPGATEAQSSGFSDILAEAADVKKDGIVIPPALPEWKRLAAHPSVPIGSDFKIVEGIPVPAAKPLHVVANKTFYDQDPNADSYIPLGEWGTIRTRNREFDERQAGGRVPSPPPASAMTERIYANIEKLKETHEPSPFKNVRLQKAGTPSYGDPVILFFQESTSNLEVGQIDILEADVIKAMKHQPGLNATIYGYAADDREDSERPRSIALSRALMIREYMIDKRIDPQRIDVKTMGSNTPIFPKDRVDITMQR